MQLGELPALDAEAFVVRQMPVQHVHLQGGHTVEIAPHHVERHEVPANVNQQPTPCEARLVLNGEGREGKPRRSYFYKLQKRLQAMECTQSIGRGKSRASWSDLERVGFVLAEFLNLTARVFAMDYQSCLGGISPLLEQRHSSLPA